MRLLALPLIAVMLSAGCNSAAPTAPIVPTTPTPPPFPSLLGVWVGTWHSHVSTKIPIPGVRRTNSTVDCATTWLIEQQTGGFWRGHYTITGHPHCESTGEIGGTVNVGRVVTMGRADNVFVTELGPCRLTYNDTMYRGALSTNERSLTLAVEYVERCSYPPGDLDWTVEGLFTLTRR